MLRSLHACSHCRGPCEARCCPKDARARRERRLRAFASGSLVTLIVHHRGRLRGDTPGARRSFDAYGVAILTVTEGKVTAHVDYSDYETIDRQFGGLAVE